MSARTFAHARLLVAVGLACAAIGAHAADAVPSPGTTGRPPPAAPAANHRAGPAATEGQPGLRVFLIAHSHCDAGWILTPDEYYRYEVRHILESMTASLLADPGLKVRAGTHAC